MCLDVEAQSEHLVTGMGRDNTICGRKTNWKFPSAAGLS
jgi:hypothetical protein